MPHIYPLRQRLSGQRSVPRDTAKGRPPGVSSLHPRNRAVFRGPEAPRQVVVCYFPWRDRIILCAGSGFLSRCSVTNAPSLCLPTVSFQESTKVLGKLHQRAKPLTWPRVIKLSLRCHAPFTTDRIESPRRCDAPGEGTLSYAMRFVGRVPGACG